MPHSVDPIPDDLPTQVRLTVLGYDAELDQTHPGWRTHQPFPHLGYEAAARTKWLLKRRELLLHREGGRPAPRDWTVLVVPDPTGRKCFVVPQDPAHTARPEREITSEPPRVRP